MVPPESVPACLQSSWLADFGVVDSNKPADQAQPIKHQSNSLEASQQTTVSQNPDVQSSVTPNSAPESVQRSKTPDMEDFTISRPNRRTKHKVRLCKNCLARPKTSVSSDPLGPKTCGGKRHKIAHAHHSVDNGKLCDVCRHDPGKKPKCNTSSPYHRIPEGSENVALPLEEQRPSSRGNVQFLQSTRHTEKCPVSHHSKLKEQNCSCDHLKLARVDPAWTTDGYDHGDFKWEGNQENLAFTSNGRWRDSEQKLILHQHGGKTSYSATFSFYFNL